MHDGIYKHLMIRHFRINFILVPILIGSAIFLSCGGDEEKPEPDEPSKEDIIGSWEIVSIDGETPDELAASLLGEDGVETKATKKDYVFVADSSWYANLEFQGEIDLGDGVSVTFGMTFTVKGKYTVSGSKLSFVNEEVNVILNPKDLWESIGIAESALEQEFRRDFHLNIDNATWSLSGNTLTLTDDKGSKTVLRK